jgi:iron complex outermembrane recepter protein
MFFSTSAVCSAPASHARQSFGSCRAVQLGNHNLLVSAVACACLAWQLPVLAATEVEEIVVIGQGLGSLRLGAANSVAGRLGLTALETPASVDLITGAEIAIKGDYGALEAITRSAGLAASANNGNGGLQVSSRGFNGHNTTINTYDGTRLYITSGTVTFPADTWILDRVEVLRGAGSVINGIGALATTINYVPKAPVFGESDFDGLLAVGSFGMHRMALGGGAQINEQLAFRLDGAHSAKDGYVDRTNEERQVLAGSLLFRPSENFSMKFSVDHANVEPGTYWGTPLVNGRASEALRRVNFNFSDAVVKYEDTWSRVHSEWRLSDNVLFRNDTFHVSAERQWQNLEEYYDAGDGTIDRMSYLGIVHDQEQVGTRSDFLFTGSIGSMDNRFSIGAELNKIDMDYLNNFNTGGFDVADKVPLFGFDPGLRPASAFTQLDWSSETRQYGFFFDNVLNVSENLSLVLGGRYDNFDFDRVNHAQLTGRGRSEFDAGFSTFTWRAGVVYQLSDSFSLYAQTSTAADPVTSPISINLANADFNLSEGRQYEVGMKQQFLGGRAEYTLAWFDIQKEDLVTRLPGATVSSQIGQQSSDGLEFTLRLVPLDKLSVDFNAAFVDSQYDTFYTGTSSLAGNTPANVPDSTFNLWVNWAPVTPLQLGVGMRYVDERYGNDSNTQTLPEYTVFDASAAWVLSEQATVILRARNFTNEKDYVLSQYVGNQWVFGEPRAYELSLRYAF